MISAGRRWMRRRIVWYSLVKRCRRVHNSIHSQANRALPRPSENALSDQSRSLLFHHAEQIHRAGLGADAAGDTFGGGLPQRHHLHRAGLHAVAAAHAELLVNHVNAGLGVLGDGAVGTGAHALAALYAGLDLAAQWWIPTDHGFKHHMIMIPVQGNFMYLFDTTKMNGAGPLTAVGPWLSMGVGLNVFTWDNGDKTKAEFAASFAWGIGAQLSFNNNWGLKAGFGGNAGGDKWFHWSHDYFMAEATYRF